VLTWLASGLLVAAALVALRWVRRRRDALGRPRPFPVISVVLLALLGAGLFVPVVRHHRLEVRLSNVASALVGHRVQVHCQTVGQEFVDAGPELGYVRFRPGGVPERQTLIKRAPCSDLASYLHSDRSHPTRDEVVAVHVLSHEARHMAGTLEEARAECEAMQQDARAARLLGADRNEAGSLARTYWRLVYPQMPDDYRSADCRPGGTLDEHLPQPPWAR
jgi:hypothetical protein